MIKLRTLLLCDKFYYLVLILTLVVTIVRFYIPIKSSIDINSNIIQGTVTSIKYDGDNLNIILKVNRHENIVCNYYFKNYDEYIYIKKKLLLGMKIKLYGNINLISHNSVDNTFSYKNYLKVKHINYMFYSKKIVILDNKISIFYRFKNIVLKYLSFFKSGSYIKMLLLGDTSFVSNKVIDSFRKNGISHLFAISGTQVTVLAEFVISNLKKAGIKEKNRYIIVNIFIIIYMLLTGSPPAILRAVIFFFLSSINKYNYFYVTNLNLFILTLCITLLINPYYVYDLGFLYSYIISMALIMCSKILDGKRYIYSLFLTSFISFLVSVPITLYNFYEFNFMSIIYNLFYVPFVNNLLFPLAIISIFFYPLDYILNFFIYILEKSSLFLSGVNFGRIIFPKLNILYYLLYYVLLFLIYKYNKKIFTFIFCLMLLFHFTFYRIFNYDYVYYFDVLQGDSILVHSDNYNILIDTGGIEKYYQFSWMKRKNNSSISINSLIPYFKSKGIKNINFLVISHGDYDHMGEAINLVNNFKVEKVIFNCGPYNDLEKELIKVLDKKYIKYYSCIKELNIDNNKLYFLQTKVYDNENDNSNVIYTELNGYKFMFMGDASTITEKEIIDKYNLPNIDVLKVGHHGSRTSSGKEFIDEINPKYGVISVGKNNRYGHPNKEVLNNLEQSKIYRTDQNGSIMFKIKNNKLKIETCVP